MNEEYSHRPVLLQEVLEVLHIRPGGVYLDGTYGRGGHAGAILQRLGPQGRLLALDKDPQAVESGLRAFGHDARFSIEQGSFGMLEQVMQRHGGSAMFDGILLDLGISSAQLDDPRRGFSFTKDGPLDMRLDPTVGVSAAGWLNQAAERDIADVLHIYGEERYARRIARAIVQARPIDTTGRLAAIVARAAPVRERHKHPATRSFQAIRIFINRELEALEAGLEQALKRLAPGGRLAVISFHSLEDRIVKRFMRAQARGTEPPPGPPVMQAVFKPTLRVLGKPIRPGAQEVASNPRARSALLRVAERLP